jgi:ATP-dependent Clp protease ATP-binding subunit ClpC
VQEVLKLARRAADDRCHSYVDTGHVMLGILTLDHGVGLCAMTRLKVNFLRLQRDIEMAFPAGRRVAPRDTIPCTPLVKQVISEHGCREAKALGHSYLGTEHLFLGILRSRRSAVFTALKKQSIEIEPAREAVRLCLSKGPEPVPNQAPASASAPELPQP